MNLSTNYLGLTLKNPIVASSSPLSHSLDGIRSLEDAGASAVVMYSLFEEQITFDSLYVDHYLRSNTNSHAEALSYFPEMDRYNVWPDEYVDLIRRAKEACDIPIIGSLNGVSIGGWTNYAGLIEDAGADALELNIYYVPTSLEITGREVEDIYVDMLRQVKRSVTIPLAIKLSPFFSSVANMSKRLVDHGANGLVLFNRFYQPDLDIERLEVTPRLILSNPHELRLPLRWVAILYGRLATDFAITTGIHAAQDVLKGLMAGAKVTMMASELLQNGVGRINDILEVLAAWMAEHEYESVTQMIGSMSQQYCAEPAAFERANYMKVLDSYQTLS